MNNQNLNPMQRTPLGIKNMTKNKNIIEDKISTNKLIPITPNKTNGN